MRRSHDAKNPFTGGEGIFIYFKYSMATQP